METEEIDKLNAFGGDGVDLELLDAVLNLTKKIRILEDECGKGISDLQKDTKEMIELVRIPSSQLREKPKIC